MLHGALQLPIPPILYNILMFKDIILLGDTAFFVHKSVQ
jgi:hypothetical protein